MKDESAPNAIDDFPAFLHVILQTVLNFLELVSLLAHAHLRLKPLQQHDLSVIDRLSQIVKTCISTPIPSTMESASSINFKSSLDVCSLSIFWLISCFCSHSSSLLSIFSICPLKCSRSSSKNLAFLAFMVAIRSSKCF